MIINNTNQNKKNIETHHETKGFVKVDNKQIARTAGVSPATVSRVLNQPELVKPTTRNKVLAVMEQFSYTPNFSAQLLAGKRSNTIGVFLRTEFTTKIQTLEELQIDYILRCILTYLSVRNYHTLVTLIFDKDDLHTQRKITEVFYQKRIDAGIFIGFPENFETIETLVKQGFCVGIFDHNTEFKKEPNRIVVNLDDTTGERSVDYLYSLGHRRIAALHGDLNRYNGLQKYNGFLKGMQKYGLSIPDEWSRFTDFKLDEAYRQALHILESGNHPTAIAATNDSVARYAINAIVDYGLRTPQDISVIGVDDSFLGNYSEPLLTTFRIDFKKMMEVLTDKVLEHLEDPLKTQFTAVFASTLVERNTCRKID